MHDEFMLPGASLLRARFLTELPPLAYLAWRNSCTRKALSYHEAGHAVLAMAWDVPLWRAVVESTGDSGAVSYDIPQQYVEPVIEAPSIPIEWERLNAIKVASLYHAGIEAEMLVGGFCAPLLTEWRIKHTSDFDVADRALGELFWRGKPHGYAQRLCRAVLARNRCALESIARWLMRTGEWVPADTPGLVVNGEEAAEAALAACLAYGDQEPPAIASESA